MNRTISDYTPQENARRIKLAMDELSAGREICFMETPSDVTVSFKKPLSASSSERILLFQQFVQGKLGTLPEIVKQIPHAEESPDNVQFGFSLRTTKPWN